MRCVPSLIFRAAHRRSVVPCEASRYNVSVATDNGAHNIVLRRATIAGVGCLPRRHPSVNQLRRMQNSPNQQTQT